MDVDDAPGLSVGFEIQFGDSFGQLRKLEDVVGDVAARVYREAQKIEQSMGGVRLDGSISQMTAFGNAATRQMKELKEAQAAAEKSGEGFIRQMQRQIDVFGKTRAEIRNMRAEVQATAAEKAGLTELAGRIRAADAELNRLEASTAKVGAAGRRSGFALQQIALQMPDIVQGLLTGQKPMTVFIQQGGQIAQVAQMADGGVKGFAIQLGGLALRFAPVIAGLGLAAAGAGLFVRWINQGVTNDQLTRDLGKITGGADATKAELYKMKDATIEFGDVATATFSVVGKDIASNFTSDMKGMGKDVKDVLDDLTTYGRQALAGIYAGLAGTRSYLGEIEKGGFGGLGKMLLGQGDPKLLENTYGKTYEEAFKYLGGLGARIQKEAIKNARERNAKTIGYNTPTAPKVDHHAEALARAAEATEALIRNNYALATAYGESGAAALIAQARLTAESKAIRQRADVELAVAREVRLAVSQRVSDAAKSTAALTDQAKVQELVNRQVADGNVPAMLAAQIVRDRLADLPLLNAAEAARRVGDKAGADAATKALDEQRDARARLTDAEKTAAIQSAMLDGSDRLAQIREEIRLIGATDAARVKSLAILSATQQASRQDWTGPDAAAWIAQQGEIAAGQHQLTLLTDAANASLTEQADLMSAIADNAAAAARGMADAFGDAGRALGDTTAIFAAYAADQARLSVSRQAELKSALQLHDVEKRAAEVRRVEGLYAVRSATAQVGLFGDMTAAAKGFFDEKSKGYKALMAAEKVYRAFEFAMSVKSMIQDVSETISSVANSGARAAAAGAEGVANQAKLPFPANIAAMAATAAALVAAGVTVLGVGGSGKNSLPKSNEGTGTVFGDPAAKSESIKRSLDGLRDVDLLMLATSREMAASLRSIEDQIGGVASLVVRAGDVNANVKVNEGFQKNLIGSVLSKIPLIGGILGGLFGSKTEVVGGGLYGKAQSLGTILNSGFDASYYSDVKRTSSFLGIKTGTKYSTQYTGADAGLENQFTQILREFNNAIIAAAGPLGVATSDITSRLNGMVVDIGKIDLKGLSGEQIQEKLTAVFGATADRMASGAFPGFERFQKVGEGLFETVVRVSSTVEAVTSDLDMLGASSRTLGVDAKVGLAAQFESLSAMQSATEGYFTAFYTPAEQNAAKLSRLGKVFVSLGTTMPSTLEGFRKLVEAQDLTTAAGQSTYATLLQLAPAFADLKGAMEGAKSAADILAEREGLQRQLLELAGDTAALRKLDLAKLDMSNRALQEQVWAVKDAQEAAKAADELRNAWRSVGDSIMDEVKRIRGLSGADANGNFASLLGQFNATTEMARAGDQDAAKSLPGLSQALLKSASEIATSRQELDRVQAQTAASLEQTYAIVQKMTSVPSSVDLDRVVAAMQVAPGSGTSTSDVAAEQHSEIASMREEIAALRRDLVALLADVKTNTGTLAKTMTNVTAQSGGDAISTVQAA